MDSLLEFVPTLLILELRPVESAVEAEDLLEPPSKEASTGTLVHGLIRRHGVDVFSSCGDDVLSCAMLSVGCRKDGGNVGAQAWERFEVGLTSSLILGSCPREARDAFKAIRFGYIIPNFDLEGESE